MSKSLKKEIADTIEQVAIDMYCDETHHLGDELERNEHEISEAKDVMQRLVPQLLTLFMEKAREFKSNRAGPATPSRENYNQGCIDVQHDFYAFLESLFKEATGD